MLPPLRTDRVVVKSTADVQGLSVDLWAGALEGPAAALVHLEVAAVHGCVQEGRAVDRSPPGHIEDPCHAGIHQRHTGPSAEHPQHYLGEVALPLGGHGGQSSQHDPNGTEVGKSTEGKRCEDFCSDLGGNCS